MNKKSPKNKTLYITDNLIKSYATKCLKIENKIKNIETIKNKTIIGSSFEILKMIPTDSVDLVVTDPPYNIEKKFNQESFKRMIDADYIKWLDIWIKELRRILKNTGSIYICCDWNSSPLVWSVMKKYFIVRNRITWEREKGRASLKNWKNNIEDIYFATVSDDYTFNLNKVMIKKDVLAPYRDGNGNAKDWFLENGKKYRLTAPSNVWTDITIPYWSMKENTEHPTQKPEKLIAKLILASSNENDLVLDPFLGSGTTSVVAKKLKRNYIGIEIDTGYASICEKRLEDINETIQGYNGKYFLARGTKE